MGFGIPSGMVSTICSGIIHDCGVHTESHEVSFPGSGVDVRSDVLFFAESDMDLKRNNACGTFLSSSCLTQRS